MLTLLFAAQSRLRLVFFTRLLGALLLLSLPRLVAAQQSPARAYSFAASQGTYPMLPGVSGIVQDIHQDSNESRTYSIGFPFRFEGQDYTEFAVSSEGWMSLLPRTAQSTPDNNLASTGTATRPLLAPFWDDLNGNLGTASYVTYGTAPNREFIMEWRNWRWPNNALEPGGSNNPRTTLSFQVKLYEATGVIQYFYRQEAAVPFPTDNLSASIGLAGYGGFLSLSDASAAPTVSSTVSTNTINQRPATGQIYTFTPPPLCPGVTGVTATATSPTTATVGFVPGSGNPGSFTLTYISQITGATQTAPANASPALLTGLAPNTRYSVSVVSNCSNGTASTASTAVLFTTPPLPNAAATWTGAIGTAWDTGGNWSSGTVPTLTTDISIPATPNQPIVTGPQVCGALTLQAGATLTLATASGSVLTHLSTSGSVLLPSGSTVVQAASTSFSVGGDWINNGATLTLAPSSVVTFGEGAHELSGTAPSVLQNLTVTSDGELSVAGALSVQRLLTTTQGGFVNVDAGGTLRLLSNAQGSAQIVRDATGFVTGPVTVERTLRTGAAGVPAGPARWFYAAPVRTGTLAGLAAPGFAPVVNAAYNTSATPATVVPFPTVFGYDQSRINTNTGPLADWERGFNSPADLSEALTPGLGYRVDAAGATTLAVTGLLTVNTVNRNGLTRATLPQSGYHLLGNPFAATLDWNGVVAATATTGLDGAVYVYQPASATAGTFQCYVNGVGASRYLLPGQAFFVRVSTASTPANVAFTQAARFPGYFDPASPPATAETRPIVQLTLAGPNAGPTDGATVYFENGATTGFDRQFDAHKLPTEGVPYFAFAGAEPLAISGLPALGSADVTLPLDVRVPAAGSYTLTATRVLNLPAGTYAYLRDAQTNAAIDLAQQPAYAFDLNSTAASSRFSLVFTRTRILKTAAPTLAQQVVLFPNPARNAVQLELPKSLHHQALSVTMINALGQVVRTGTLPAGTGVRQLPLDGAAPGVYLLRLVTAEGIVTKRLVLE